jgi:hypothetical protein
VRRKKQRWRVRKFGVVNTLIIQIVFDAATPSRLILIVPSTAPFSSTLTL